MWNSKFLNFSRWLGTFNCCTNKNVGWVKLINILLFEGIKAILLAPNACGLTQSLQRTDLSPRTRVGKHCLYTFSCTTNRRTQLINCKQLEQSVKRRLQADFQTRRLQNNGDLFCFGWA